MDKHPNNLEKFSTPSGGDMPWNKSYKGEPVEGNLRRIGRGFGEACVVDPTNGRQSTDTKQSLSAEIPGGTVTRPTRGKK